MYDSQIVGYFGRGPEKMEIAASFYTESPIDFTSRIRMTIFSHQIKDSFIDVLHSLAEPLSTLQGLIEPD